MVRIDIGGTILYGAEIWNSVSQLRTIAAVGIKTTHRREYIEFCKYHAPTPEELARRKRREAGAKEKCRKG